MTHKLILCADDFALSPAVSRGILEALHEGRLNAASALTTTPFWRGDARSLSAPGLDAAIGIHINLTLGSPLSAMPAFAPAFNFPPLGAVLRGAMLGSLPQAEIRAEIARQIDAFVEAYGHPPDFVDGHQHIQVLPGIRRWLLEELAKRGWAGRMWVRDSTDDLSRIFARRAEIPKALALVAFGLGFKALAESFGFESNDGFAGFSAFDARADYSRAFDSYLKAPGARHLVMCHPGHVDAELIVTDPVTTTRENELTFLLSPAFREALRRANMRLSRWDRQD